MLIGQAIELALKALLAEVWPSGIVAATMGIGVIMGIRLIRKAANIAVVVLTLFTQSCAAHAAEIEVLTLISQKPWLDLVLPEFERTTGHKILVKYGGSTDLIKRFEAGEAFDVALASSLLIESLLEQGKVAAGTRADIARAARSARLTSRASQAPQVAERNPAPCS